MTVKNSNLDIVFFVRRIKFDCMQVDFQNER